MNENITPLPCPACGGTDLTEPFDANFEYVVCQHCGLRAELDSWTRIPRLTARVKELEEALTRIANRPSEMDWGHPDEVQDAMRAMEQIADAALNKEPTT